MITNKPKNLLLCVSGGIAAYKTPELVRRIREQGFEVQVVLSDAASQFVTAAALQAVSANRVRSSLWDAEAEAAMGHIELARWADVILVAPASANTLAKLAGGFADNLLTTLCLATDAALVLAPAMNRLMWAHPATQANLEVLKSRGAVMLGPASGEQACGEVGPGRMLEVAEIVESLMAFSVDQPLSQKRIVITAGPTQEAIDPVRFISNHSSGKMGFALAEKARQMGAEVTLISGPVGLVTPAGVRRIDVVSAQQMHAVALEQAENADAFYAVAAVADARPTVVAAQKIKKEGGLNAIELVENPDIVAAVAAMERRPKTVIAFAAESQNHDVNAKQKLKRKGVDFIAVNNILGLNTAFAADDNQLTLYSASDRWPAEGKISGRLNKRVVAKWLLELTL